MENLSEEPKTSVRSVFWKVGTVICLPLLIAYGTVSATWLIERNKLELEYVRIASGILQNVILPGDKEDESKRRLRRWAVEILIKYSPKEVRFPDSQPLIDGKINLPPGALSIQPVTVADQFKATVQPVTVSAPLSVTVRPTTVAEPTTEKTGEATSSPTPRSEN